MVRIKKILLENEIQYEPISVVDKSGRIFYWQDRVFRKINDLESWNQYKDLIQSPFFDNLIVAGLIETWIPDDVILQGCAGILEHKRIDFISTIAEWTVRMLWDAAKVYLDLAVLLAKNGMTFKDGHPWNILFDFCYPKMIDFGSIIPDSIYSDWVNEFRIRFIAPLVGYKYRYTRKLANEIRYEHLHGVGLALLSNRYGSILPIRFNSLIIQYRHALQINDRHAIIKALKKMRDYLDKLCPIDFKENWANYQQIPESEVSIQKEKTKAVLDVLQEYRPDTVLDIGANKGWYTFLAESHGSKVIAFDYESYCVNQIYSYGKEKKSRILPLLMNLLLPTPESGVALAYKNAFDRFCSDVTLLLGMTHHLSLHQNLDFQHIAYVTARFTKIASVIEFIHPEDSHILDWSIPADYSQDNFIKAMKNNGMDLCKETKLIPTRSILVFNCRG